MSESKLKSIVLGYLSELETVDPILNPKLDFGYKFLFPKGKDPRGNPIGRTFSVVKPKSQNILDISRGIGIPKEYIDAFNKMGEGSEQKFIKNLIKILLLHRVFYRFDLENNRYSISDTIFLNKGKFVAKNNFFNSIRKVFGCSEYIILELQDYCSGEFDIDDLKFIS